MSSERVWIGATYSAGGNIYHTNKECHNLKICETSRAIDLEQAERKNARECRICAGDVDTAVYGSEMGSNGFDARRFNGTSGMEDA